MTLRRFCWFRRSLRTAPDEWSRVHLFEPERFTALCGRAIPRLYRGLLVRGAAARLCGLIEVTEGTEVPTPLCERCRKFAARLS